MWRFLALLNAVCLLVAFALPVQAGASSDYAAVLRILYAGVELRRANTAAWLALPVGAEMPFGAGDALRTDNTGRAYVLYGDQAKVFVLPRTTYETLAYALDGDVVTLHQRLQGRSVQRVTTAFSGDFRLETSRLTLTQPAVLFAVWAEADQPVTVAVDQGEAALITGAGEQVSIPASSGVVIDANARPPVKLLPPINPARLIAAQSGCPGIVDTIDDIELRVRTQPGLGYFIMGGFDEGSMVQILGRNANSTWYRVRYASDLGWVEALAVDTVCANLPVLPDTPAFDIYGILYVQPDELALLKPFYGLPADDKWFYREAELPPDETG